MVRSKDIFFAIREEEVMNEIKKTEYFNELINLSV
jgi:hypothetical protein